MLDMIQARDLTLGSNVRKNIDTTKMGELKASIVQKGVLQNLIATRTPGGEIVVFAGGSRLTAALELINEGLIEETFEVPVKIFENMDPDGADATVIAMSENMIRSEMSFVDECDAMKKLSLTGMRPTEIAGFFGLKARAVKERLLIAGLIDGAKDIMRDNRRGADWARALTIADKATQAKIVTDIAANPEAWATGEDIRRWISKATIEARVALFDMSEYTGPVIKDFFEGDKLADTEMFWTLQNDAIEALRLSLEAEGWAHARVVHGAVETWNYEKSEDKTVSHALVAVSPTGEVTVHRGMKPIDATIDDKVGSLDAATVAAIAEAGDGIAAWEVRPTATVTTHANKIRTAAVRRAIASDMRNALEIQVLDMLGHSDFGGERVCVHVPEKGEVAIVALDQERTLQIVNDAETEIERIGGKRDEAMLRFVRDLDDKSLNEIFRELTVAKLRNKSPRRIDDSAGSAQNRFGENVAIRTVWTPDAAFFSALDRSQAKRIAISLLTHIPMEKIDGMGAKAIVNALSLAFDQARNDTCLPADLAATLNAWTPGIMSFPAKVSMAEANALDAEVDVEEAMFS